MKAVMLSIQPKWCELIASGEKTIEVRKTVPKLETPFKCYIYCTKGRHEMLWRWAGEIYYDTQDPYHRPNKMSGKVIGEFECDRIDEYNTNYLDGEDKLKTTTCLDDQQIMDYIDYLNRVFYAWHISDLKIYDTPKELGEFFRPCDGCDKLGTSRCTEEISPCRAKTLTRPSQSWCYVEEIS